MPCKVRKWMPEVNFLRLEDVIRRVGLKRSQIYNMIKEERFPSGRKYPGTRIIFWLDADITAWQQKVLEATNV